MEVLLASISFAPAPPPPSHYPRYDERFLYKTHTLLNKWRMEVLLASMRPLTRCDVCT